jgi:hypothetical protein
MAVHERFPAERVVLGKSVFFKSGSQDNTTSVAFTPLYNTGSETRSHRPHNLTLFI